MEMSRSVGEFIVAGLMLLLCSNVNAQQSKSFARLGLLDSSNASGMAVLLDAFRMEMNRLGWLEGKNISIEYKFAEQKPDRLDELAAELVRSKVDLIVVTGTPAAIAAKRTTSAIPIVMATSADPVGAGLVASLARPGGNITGFSALSTDLNTKRLDLLKESLPRLAIVGLLVLAKGSIAQDLQVQEIKRAAEALSLKVKGIEVQRNPKGLESALQGAKQQIHAILTTSNRPFFAQRQEIIELARKFRLPAIYPQREYVEDGGLMSYGIDFGDLYRRAAGTVDKILKGAKPGDLPIETPTKFELVINLKTAKQIGVTIPPNVLARADRVLR
jgi:putative ABC transport system substrate-binding protein